jgi:hypothetical protein
MLKKMDMVIFCTLFSFLFTCKIINTPEGSASSVADLKIFNTDVWGWTQTSDVDSFVIYPANDPEHWGIDGGDVEYNNNGVIKAMFQHFSGPNGRDLSLRVMDFGTAENAIKMCDQKKSNQSDIVTIGSYDLFTVFATSSIGGVNVYAHFKKFHIELFFSGYDVERQAKQDAELFLGLFQANIR